MLALISPKRKQTSYLPLPLLVHLFIPGGANVLIVHCYKPYLIHYLHPEVVSAVVRTAEVFSYKVPLFPPKWHPLIKSKNVSSNPP